MDGYLLDIANRPQEQEYYTETYGRYLRNEAQSEMAKATRATMTAK